MFIPFKKSDKHQYLQIVVNRKTKGKVVQRVIGTIGRMGQLKAKDRIELLMDLLHGFLKKFSSFSRAKAI